MHEFPGRPAARASRGGRRSDQHSNGAGQPCRHQAGREGAPERPEGQGGDRRGARGAGALPRGRRRSDQGCARPGADALRQGAATRRQGSRPSLASRPTRASRQSRAIRTAPSARRHARRSGPRRAHDRDLRRIRLLQLPRRCPGDAPRDPLRASLGAGRDRPHRWDRGGVHAAPRTRARASAPPHQLPREHLGDARGRRAAHHRPVRLRLAQARARAGHVRDLRPVRRSHPREGEHLLRRAADHPRVSGRSRTARI